MLTILICVISGFLTIGYFSNGDFFSMLMGGIFGCGLLGIMLSAMIASFSGKKEEKIDTMRLVSLRGTNQIMGNFFLGIGSINSTPHYLYYELLNDGGCNLHKLRADMSNVLVYEEDRGDGVLELYEKISKIGPLWGLDLNENPYIYRFRIPTGSIKREFAL